MKYCRLIQSLPLESLYLHLNSLVNKASAWREAIEIFSSRTEAEWESQRNEGALPNSSGRTSCFIVFKMELTPSRVGHQFPSIESNCFVVTPDSYISLRPLPLFHAQRNGGMIPFNQRWRGSIYLFSYQYFFGCRESRYV